MWLTNLRISRKLVLGFAVVVCTIIGANSMSWMNLDNLQSIAQRNSDSSDALAAMQEAATDFNVAGRAISTFAVAGKASYRDELVSAWHDLGAAMDRATALTAPARPDLAAAIASSRKLTQSWWDTFGSLQLARMSDASQLQEMRDFTNDGAGVGIRSPAVFADLNAIIAKLRTWSDDEDAAQSHSMTVLRVILLAGAAGSLLLSVAAGWVLSRAIGRPVVAMTSAMKRLADGDMDITVPAIGRKDEVGDMADAVQVFKDAAIAKVQMEVEATEARRQVELTREAEDAKQRKANAEQAAVVNGLTGGLSHLAQGDLTFRLEDEFAPGYEQLRKDFNAAVLQLSETVRQLMSSTATIKAGAGEIAQASDDLSRRTEQQAASLEETAAALDEITATVRKTAEGANAARDVVARTRTDAEQSGEVVRQAVGAMGSIEQSSQQISQIIGVIDEIAFQTNLLALNAGVEAARAGDAGRGFAVVASEVRALAQRSAQAAKEIKAIISTSAQQVGAGVKLVGQTGQALDRIVTHVTEISTAVSDIAASAQEQATALHEVNSAINQMDQVTQQNAAMVEETTAASHSLAHETMELASLTARFQIDDAEDAAPADASRAAARPRVGRRAA
ncbi:methyl-accepting chemotaxis protein [Acidisphaera sp. L21]|uniref:methyl-accepting chemotaxis protein n=1 Tax=Acidisphaera sp. L21 TaxID=1641851 RepID=UPI0020B12977|nr:methyl-accepting chemotaxis protein [Acidisphaera sp. L21]